MYAVQILAQCPLLGEVYVDAWPITSYLRRSLKEHKSGGNKSKGGDGSRCGPATVTLSFSLMASVSILTFAQPTTKPVLNKCAYVAIPSRQGTQKTQYMTKKAKVSFSTSTTSNSRAIARSYSPSEKAVEDILELSDSECESKEGPASSQPSNCSGNAHSKTCMSSAETASIISATEGSPGIDEYVRQRFIYYVHLYTRQQRADMHLVDSQQNEKSDYDVEFIEDPDEEYPSTVRTDHPRPHATHTTRATLKHLSHVGSPSVNPFVIRDMFISRGLSVADAQRVALLLSSLGIVDTVGLRVLSRLTFCETWISEMRQKESLDEVEAGVIRDVLDTFRETA